MISKELLSEVLNIENERISRKVDKFCFPNTNTIAVQYYMTDGWQHINIYELAHKCKEWAFNNSEIIISFKYRDEQNQLKWIAETTECRFRADTEPEAIFKACEWVLKEMR